MRTAAEDMTTPAVERSRAHTLAAMTTLRVGGPVGSLVEADSEAELIETIQAADRRGEPLLVLGGGSNVLASDAPFEGVVLRDRRRGITVETAAACGGATIRIPAGQPWDDVVLRAVAEGWRGIEALSGIPGSTGATPVQNVGAYGQEISEVVAAVRTWDRATDRVRTLTRSELQFDYRSSVLKASFTDDGAGLAWRPTPRYVVLDVQLQLVLADTSAPIRYPELARSLAVSVGDRAPSAEVREAVLDLRRGKGMVLIEDDHDTWSAGSFFTNPVLSRADADRLPLEAPRFDVSGGRVKTSAAWLISHCGFSKGEGLPGPAALSSKHVLALTNRGSARATDLLELAARVRAGVQETYGITLVPEPVLVGVDLP